MYKKEPYVAHLTRENSQESFCGRSKDPTATETPREQMQKRRYREISKRKLADETLTYIYIHI